MQDNSKFVEPYITYTLKDNALNIKENDVAFIPYGHGRKNPNEDIPYETIKAIYLKKELRSNKAERDISNNDYYYFCEIYFHHKPKITVKNFWFKSNLLEVVKDTEYECFVKGLIGKLADFPNAKIYAYEEAGAKINRTIPVIGTIGLIIEILLDVFILPFFITDIFDIYIIGIITFVFIVIAVWIGNYYFKKNAEVIKSAIPAHFFPSFENEQRLLEK